MAISYLTIPGTFCSIACLFTHSHSTHVLPSATSADVERVLSRSRLILPHVRNSMSGQSIRALLCLSDWSNHDLIEDSVLNAVTSQVDTGAEYFVREAIRVE